MQKSELTLEKLQQIKSADPQATLSDNAQFLTVPNFTDKNARGKSDANEPKYGSILKEQDKVLAPCRS